MSTNWLDEWFDPEYQIKKQTNFKKIDSFLKSPPKRILDIGCGLAFESEKFQEKYGSDLYLLDGEHDDTLDRTRDIKFGPITTFKFYHKLESLKESFDSRNMKYDLIDASNIVLEDNIKFDLVYSFLCCGFHFPVDAYKDLIKKHTDKDSIIIMDIRLDTLKSQNKDFVTLAEINHGRKHTTFQIKFK